MPPLPGPPESAHHSAGAGTIKKHPHLFPIVTPINKFAFKNHLSTHPNRPLVDSVLRGLDEGFWPWAEPDEPDRPETYDGSYRPIKDDRHMQFVRDQRDAEIALGRFSPSFGTELLPGMSSIPIGVVPKPHSDKLRLVVDHSAQPHAPNALIPREKVSVPLDNLHNLGQTLR
ncbi:hypothetical protein BOTBODRAFT_109310, partial [Botryobasidium botryosum FD-172 SS1]